MATAVARTDGLARLAPRIRRHLRALGFSNEREYLRWCRSAGFTARANKNAEQMRAESRHKATEAAARSDDNALRDHLQQLGLGSVAAYRQWCRHHGLGAGLHKSAAQRAKERAVHRGGSRRAAVAVSQPLRRDIGDTFQRIVSGRIRKRTLTDPVLMRLHELLHEHRDGDDRAALLELILWADRQAGRGSQRGLLDVSPVIERLGAAAGNTMLDALLALARHRASWLRPLDGWQPTAKSSRHAFGELARHLLAEYPVPSFMDSAWFAGLDGPAVRQQRWFIHIGQGNNIRSADVPLRLTKRMAHLYPRAPAHYSIHEALRWAQVLGLGGDRELAEHIVATRLGEHLDQDQFWIDVVHFFVNNPMVDYDQFAPIVDYVHHQRLVAVEGPPQPEFSMKGRTATRLLELVDEWHDQLARSAVTSPTTWPVSGIDGFEQIEEHDGRTVCWTITELGSHRQLVEEGRAMHHCVASYARYCSRGQKSVWSLAMRDLQTDTSRRVLTVAVKSSVRRVVQARGRCNVAPGVAPRTRSARRLLRQQKQDLERGQTIMRQWAAREQITVPRVT